MSKREVWTNRMQEFLVANIHMKQIDIANILEVNVSLVNHKRTEIIRLGTKAKKIETTEAIKFERPKAEYSNRSPYGIASPGLD